MTDFSTPGVAEEIKILESIFQNLLNQDMFGIPKLNDRDDVRTHIDELDNYIKTCGIQNEEAKATIFLKMTRN